MAQSSKGIFVSQRPYMLQLIEDVGFHGYKVSKTPIEPNLKLTMEEGALLEDAGQYRRLIGKLLYLTITRPELSFVVNRVS